MIFIRLFTDAISELPIIKQFNRTGGTIYGVLEGFCEKEDSYAFDGGSHAAGHLSDTLSDHAVLPERIIFNL